jgi:hypothetical protein
MRVLILSLLVLVASCKCTPIEPSMPDSGGGTSTASVTNATGAAASVYVAFGTDSVVLPPSWTFCTSIGPLGCTFQLAANGSQVLPLGGQYLNATISFNSVVGCGVTKAELNLNNPNWYDIIDISLVDGWSNNVSIQVGSTTLGPTLGKTGNEKVLGVFPLGCDICVARQNPPCGISKGTDGCKTGSQYNPDAICQYQGSVKGGGSAVTVTLH